MAKYYSDAMRRLQRKLIPVNIVVMVLCLVAAVSLIFMPFIQFDIGKILSALPLEEMGLPEEIDVSVITDALEGTEIPVSAYSLYQFASSEDPAGYLVDVVMDFVEEHAVSMVKAVLPIVSDKLDLEEFGIDFDFKDLETEDIEAIFEKVGELGTTNVEERNQKIDDLISLFQDTFNYEATDEERDAIKEAVNGFVDTTLEYADEFTVESAICVAASRLMNGSEDGEGEEEKSNVATSYAELFESFVGGEDENPDGTSEMTEMLNEWVGYMIYFVYAMLFFAGVWMLLFLFALLHTFARNKRFMMWYVKLLGAYPCIIFWLFPILVPMALPQLAAVFTIEAEVVTMLTGIFGATSSMAWISGACYLLLWLVSIFWAFPIKHKIRKLKRQERREGYVALE